MASLRDLPAVEQVLRHADMADLVARFGAITVRDCVRDLQQDVRKHHRDGIPGWATDAAGYTTLISGTLRNRGYTPIFNLTGTVIHTNLGRALLDQAIWREIGDVVTRPMNLEFDLHTGKRGDRDYVVEERLKALTGCEAATIVNNNAAALLLVLNSLALNENVPVSRGELIEIGGSFRLPELMQRAGCNLLEVGTTNRTHLQDFAAVADQAAMMLKVHPSNYHIAGFTREVDAAELATLAQQHNLPSCVDLGAGTLVDLTRWGLPAEPTPQSVLQQGIDVVTFSGDKLLGGVQAGMIVGRKDLLAKIKSNPMKRALRADKITLAILDAVLRRYEDPETLVQNIPVLKALTLDEQTLRQRGAAVLEKLPDSWHAELAPTHGQIGSGALPDKTLNSVAVKLRPEGMSLSRALKLLRDLPTPVIGRIADDHLWLDLRGADPLDALLTNLAHLP